MPLECADKIIEYLDLTKVARRPAGDLPFGTQKRVEMGRALAADPKLRLLLKEPAAGLNHEELEDLDRLILDVRNDLGVTMLLVEHHMSLVMSVSDHIVALSFGKKIAEASSKITGTLCRDAYDASIDALQAIEAKGRGFDPRQPHQ